MKSSTSPSYSRRGLIGLALAGLAAPLAACVSAAPSGVRGPFNRVIVDTGPLAATGASELATNVQPLLARSVTAALGGRTGVRGAPDLVVTVNTLTLAMFGGLGGGDRLFPFGPDSSPLDFLSGTVTVRRGGEVLDVYPLTVNAPASNGGLAIDPRSEWRRIAALCDAVGYWIVRRYG